jgi:hypothetical protein
MNTAALTAGPVEVPAHGVGDDQHHDHRVQDQAEHGDPVVRMALLGLRVAVQRGQHAQQDRQHRDREPHRDQDRAPPPPAFTDGFQRAEDRRGEDGQEQHSQPRIDLGRLRRVLGCVLAGGEEADLEQQHTGDGRLQRDHRLEVLNRDLHGHLLAGAVVDAHGGASSHVRQADR